LSWFTFPSKSIAIRHWRPQPAHPVYACRAPLAKFQIFSGRVGEAFPCRKLIEELSCGDAHGHFLFPADEMRHEIFRAANGKCGDGFFFRSVSAPIRFSCVGLGKKKKRKNPQNKKKKPPGAQHAVKSLVHYPPIKAVQLSSPSAFISTSPLPLPASTPRMAVCPRANPRALFRLFGQLRPLSQRLRNAASGPRSSGGHAPAIPTGSTYVRSMVAGADIVPGRTVRGPGHQPYRP